MKWASTDNLKWIDQENKTKSDELLNANKSSENLKNSLIKTCKSSRDQRELLNFEHKFISTEECESEANPHLTIKNEKVVIHSQNSGSKNNSKNKETENLKQQNGKSSGCLLNKVLPFKRISQLPNTPSIEFDINDGIDDDEVQITVVTEEIMTDRDITDFR